MAGGLPSLAGGGRRGLVLERFGEDLKAWVLVLKNTGSVTADENGDDINNKIMILQLILPQNRANNKCHC